jgi:hypothetical protein
MQQAPPAAAPALACTTERSYSTKTLIEVMLIRGLITSATEISFCVLNCLAPTSGFTPLL